MKKLSPETLALLKEYEATWQKVFDAVYNDLSEEGIGYDIQALEDAGKLVPRPLIFPTADK